MAELTATEKLQPCLVERLTDEDPHSQLESRTSRVVSLPRYREAVLRDIKWLLNTKKPRSEEGLDALTEASESVLNFGMQDLCGLTASHMNIVELERSLEQAIKLFEPRINRHTLSVKVIRDAEKHSPTTIAFEIRGELWAQPIPEQLFIRTKLDLETGLIEVI